MSTYPGVSKCVCEGVCVSSRNLSPAIEICPIIFSKLLVSVCFPVYLSVFLHLPLTVLLIPCPSFTLVSVSWMLLRGRETSLLSTPSLCPCCLSCPTQAGHKNGLLEKACLVPDNDVAVPALRTGLLFQEAEASKAVLGGQRLPALVPVSKPGLLILGCSSFMLTLAF